MFIVLWQGFGFLAFLVPFLVALVFNLALGPYWDTHRWPFFVAMLVAAPVVWFLGRFLNNRPGRALLDPKTGQQVTLRKRHSLFWIPMQYWGIAWLGLGVLSLWVKF